MGFHVDREKKGRRVSQPPQGDMGTRSPGRWCRKPGHQAPGALPRPLFPSQVPREGPAWGDADCPSWPYGHLFRGGGLPPGVGQPHRAPQEPRRAGSRAPACPPGALVVRQHPAQTTRGQSSASSRPEAVESPGLAQLIPPWAPNRPQGVPSPRRERPKSSAGRKGPPCSALLRPHHLPSLLLTTPCSLRAGLPRLEGPSPSSAWAAGGPAPLKSSPQIPACGVPPRGPSPGRPLASLAAPPLRPCTSAQLSGCSPASPGARGCPFLLCLPPIPSRAPSLPRV